MAWQRKHRPKIISELHLTNVRDALSNLMKAHSFPQVFLFAGPKGTGKTSASRILGAMLNDPKNAELVDGLFFKKPIKKNLVLVDPDVDSDFSQKVYAGSSFVVQEMDAASHRGIDDVRALKERAMLPPQEGKITVYILDEAHMLTTEAFNALLKLLEEPPAHAVFILATTEIHKIPDTIVSRSFHLAFRKATTDELTAALKTIIQKEELTAEDEAVKIIVQRADGSFRDGVKLLESVVSDGQVNLQTVEKALGKNAEPIIIDVLTAVLDKNENQVSELINELRQQKFAEKYVYQVLFNLLHQSLLRDLKVIEGKPLFNQKVARFLLDELLQANLDAFSPISFLALEIKFLALIERSKQKTGGGTTQSKKKINQPVNIDFVEDKSTTVEAVDLQIEKELNDFSEEITVKKNLDFATIVEETPAMEDTYKLTEEVHELGKSLLANWDEFIQIVQQKNATVAALLRSGKPSLSETGVPEVLVYYKFHKEQLQQQKHMSLLLDCVYDLVGGKLPLQVALRDLPTTASLVEIDKPSAQLTQLAAEALM